MDLGGGRSGDLWWEMRLEGSREWRGQIRRSANIKSKDFALFFAAFPVPRDSSQHRGKAP